MSAVPKSNQQSATFTHGDFLTKAAKEAGVDPAQLSERPDPEAREIDLSSIARQTQPELDPNAVNPGLQRAIEQFPYDQLSQKNWINKYRILFEYVDVIAEELGEDLSSKNIEIWWNAEIKDWLADVETESGGAAAEKVRLMGPLISALLRKVLKGGDYVQLRMPDERALFDEIGSGMERGTLEVNGNVAGMTGANAGGTARIVINGNAFSSVGQQAHGEAEIIINGNAGEYVGMYSFDEAHIVVSGSVKAGYGQDMQGRAKLEVGSVKNPSLDSPGVVDANFQGTISVDGRIIDPPRRGQ